MRISDWSSDVCAPDLRRDDLAERVHAVLQGHGANLRGGRRRTLRRPWDGLCQRPPRNPRRILGSGARFMKAPLATTVANRQGERRVREGCVSTWHARWPPYHHNKKYT